MSVVVVLRSDAVGDVHPGGQVEFFELVHGAGGGIDDIEDALVSADFELLGRFFVHVDGAVDAEDFGAGGERNGPGDARASALGGLDDFDGGAVDGTVIEGTQADPDFLR